MAGFLLPLAPRAQTLHPPLQSAVGASSEADVVGYGRTALDNKTSLLNTPSPRSFAGPRFRDYNPYNYSDTLDKAAAKEAFYEGTGDLRDGQGPVGKWPCLQNKKH